MATHPRRIERLNNDSELNRLNDRSSDGEEARAPRARVEAGPEVHTRCVEQHSTMLAGVPALTGTLAGTEALARPCCRSGP